jgi:methionine synthase II (cobalamin-independent)
VCVSTDCALASMRRVVAKNKLKSLVKGTDIVRRELTGAVA